MPGIRLSLFAGNMITKPDDGRPGRPLPSLPFVHTRSVNVYVCLQMMKRLYMPRCRQISVPVHMRAQYTIARAFIKYSEELSASGAWRGQFRDGHHGAM